MRAGAGPGEPDCQFFLKTGNCKFGESCKFNHPPEKVPCLRQSRSVCSAAQARARGQSVACKLRARSLSKWSPAYTIAY